MTETDRALCIVGVGDGGSAALNRVLDQGLNGITSVVVNTAGWVLNECRADQCIQIGQAGAGAGGRPDVGRHAAEVSRDHLHQVLRHAGRVFIVAGLGGGTGTGAAPVVARVAAEAGAETVGVISHPFTFEGLHRQQIARQGVQQLRQLVDTLVEVEGDRLLRFAHNRELPSLEQVYTLMAGAMAWHILARLV
ncbi:MAG: hypothetical protein K8I60_01465 [Anaerolineae bacterium]|nr:hypothetical protein [Anaerolineae bacterium]